MVYVLLGTGFEEVEALTCVDYLRRAGIRTATVGIGGRQITGSHGIAVAADLELGEMDLTDMDMIVLPGGLGGVAAIGASRPAIEAIRFAWDNDKFVAAICAAPTILGEMGLLEGRHATCYPGCEAKLTGALVDREAAALVDGKLITGASAGCAQAFAHCLIECLKGAEAANAVREQIVLPHDRRK